MIIVQDTDPISVDTCSAERGLKLIWQGLLGEDWSLLDAGHIPWDVGHIPVAVGHTPWDVGHMPVDVGHIRWDVGRIP